MTNVDDIPAETKWKIAAKSATAMPWIYGMAFQGLIDEKVFQEIDLQIWKEGGKEAKRLADELNLPASNAKEVNRTWGIVSTILYGPEFKEEIIEENENRVVTRITGCGFLNRAREMGIEPKNGFKSCQAYSSSIVENLNPNYSQRFLNGMCLGAPYCENIVELKK
ncbi:MAG: hypothetical protein A4E49_00824 [Methanosaeta sp. PtaU1.Bin112]|nr:MAG: hypothetical protein A4E49_00824 [Methanosaeta sp. PtaU1.Bin112]